MYNTNSRHNYSIFEYKFLEACEDTFETNPSIIYSYCDLIIRSPNAGKIITRNEIKEDSKYLFLDKGKSHETPLIPLKSDSIRVPLISILNWLNSNYNWLIDDSKNYYLEPNICFVCALSDTCLPDIKITIEEDGKTVKFTTKPVLETNCSIIYPLDDACEYSFFIGLDDYKKMLDKMNDDIYNRFKELGVNGDYGILVEPKT